MREELSTILSYRNRLLAARNRGCSARWVLRLWSQFIKARDGHRCLCCDGTSRLQAHHIVRKALYPQGVIELGNGITLCNKCHGRAHREFNGRPALTEPINARGGDDQDEWAFLFGLLHDDATQRKLDPDTFYFIDNHMLEFFVRLQGYEDLYTSVLRGELSRIRFAHEAMRGMPQVWYTNYVREILQNNL